MVLDPIRRFFLKNTRGLVNWAGFDVIRTANKPQNTFLGLREHPIRSIVDIGANEGQFARRAATFFPDARLVCFEPLSSPYARLSEWASTMSGRVEAVNAAIGDTEGTISFHEHVDSTPSSSVLSSTADQHSDYPETREQRMAEVTLTTLDLAVARLETPLQREILIKMDVQGYEESVIAGGHNVLAKASACILEVILDPLYQNQATFGGLYAALTTLGFEYRGNLEQHYAEDGRVMWFDAVFVRPNP